MMDGFKKMSELLGDQVSHGSRMGFKQGGHVAQSNTSPQFLQKTKKQDPMDPGVQPASEGTTEQDKEAGGTPKLKPRYKKGGKARSSKRKRTRTEGALASLGEGTKSKKSKKRGHDSRPLVGG